MVFFEGGKNNNILCEAKNIFECYDVTLSSFSVLTVVEPLLKASSISPLDNNSYLIESLSPIIIRTESKIHSDHPIQNNKTLICRAGVDNNKNR